MLVQPFDGSAIITIEVQGNVYRVEVMNLRLEWERPEAIELLMGLPAARERITITGDIVDK